MKYKCDSCYTEYSANNYRILLDRGTGSPLGKIENTDKYCCPSCGGKLVFMPVPKNEITCMDSEFFYIPGTVIVANEKKIELTGYNRDDFKKLGFFPSQLLAADYALLKKKIENDKKKL